MTGDAMKPKIEIWRSDNIWRWSVVNVVSDGVVPIAQGKEMFFSLAVERAKECLDAAAEGCDDP